MRRPNRYNAPRGFSRLELLAVLGIVGLLLALLLPAVQLAREDARQTQSKNNLKQIGLALHNYHDTHRCFPPGGTVMANGRAQHGWFTRICPYLDSSPLYNQIDLHRPWNDRVNQHLFQTRYPTALIPGIKWVATTEGYALIHYSANPSALYLNSSVTFDDFTAGTEHGWLMGEAMGDHEPWGSVYNWREWDRPLNSGNESFGRWLGGSQFLIADGSVRFVSDEESEQVRQSLSGGLPVPHPADVAQPDRDWEYVTTSVK